MASSLTTSNGLNLKVGMTFDTNAARQRLNTALNQLQKQAKPTIQTEVLIDNERFVKTVRTYQDALKNLVEETTLYNGAGKVMSQTITNLTSASDRAEKAIKDHAKALEIANNAQNKLNNTAKHGKNIFQDFATTFMKMAKFNTINIIYDGLISKMSEAIEITNDFDKAMTEFKKVTDTSNLSLSDYTETLGQLGEATARSATQMLEASTEFSKSGFTADESAKLAQIATLYQNIADKELSAGEAASYIISQMKAFNIGVEDAVKIVNYTNEVSNNFAVSSVDVATALTKQSASLHAYGNEMEDVIGLTTAGAEILTGNASKVARGVKTIGANIVNMAQGAKEFEIQVSGTTKTIQLWNEEGTDILSTYDVLKQVAQYWNDMSDAEKSALAISQAGKNQLDVYTAVVGNFNTAIEARKTALLSEGSAWKENEAYMESVEAHTQKLKAEWENLVLSKPIVELEKSLLNLGTTLLKFVQSDLGQAVIKFAALTATITVLYNVLNSGKAFSIFIHMLGAAAAGTGSLTGAVNYLTAAMNINPLFLAATAIAAGIMAVVKAVDLLTVSFSEAQESLDESNSSYEQAQNEITSLESKIKELQDIKDEINQEKLNITDGSQLEKLEQQTNELERQEASLQRQLALAKAKAEIAQQEAKASAKETMTKTVETDTTTVVGYGKIGGKGGVLGTRFEGAINSLKKLQDEIISNNREIEKLSENYDKNQKEIDELTKKNDILKQAYDATYKEAETLAETSQDVANALGEEIEAYDGSEITLGGLLDAFASYVGWKKDATDKTTEFTDATEDENDATDEEADNVEAASDAFANFLNSVEDLQSSYEALSKAANEYNKNGVISASTLKKLAKLQPEYVAQLEIVNGTMQVSNGLLQEEFEKNKQLALINVEVGKSLRIQALCQEYANTETKNAKTTVEETTPKIDEISTALNKMGTEGLNAARGVMAVRESLTDSGDEDALADFENKLKDIDDWANAMKDSINGVSLSVVDSAKNAASSHKDAWVEAFEEEQRLLKHSLEMNEITEYEYYERLKDLNEQYFGEISGNHEKYLKEYQENEEEIYKGMKSIYDKVKDYLYNAVVNSYEKAIKALQKEEKQVLAEIKKQIDALKKEKEKVIKGIEDEIKALKKQKEAVQKYYNDQIDAIKKENEVLQQQNQLLEYQQQLAQAKAKKIMIMQDGRFQLGEDESAVAQAEQNLSEYQDQLSYEQQIEQLEELRDATVETLEERIEALEEYKEYMTEYYDEQIEAMEEYYEQVQEQYEKQIEALQEQLDAFKEGYKKAEDLENARLAAEVMGANEEASIWQARLENLAAAVTEYNRLLSLLGEAGVGASSNYSFNGVSHNPIEAVGSIDTSVKRRASGDASFSGNEVALVGESPNTELVLGSKLNRSLGGGQLVNLSKGSGVVNAESTATLAGLLNGLSNPTTTNVANNRSTQQNFNFGTITLPNVTDADSFVNTLSHKFNNYAIQYGNVRK